MNVLTLFAVALSIDFSSLAWTLFSSIGWLQQHWVSLRSETPAARTSTPER